MLGPIFYREALVGPKRTSTYLGRGLYVLSLFMLICIGYLVLDGSRSLMTVGDSARFGGWMFSLLAPLQLVVLSALAAVGAASSVAQEKDRRTLILLLLTRLTGSELVAGKLCATLLGPMSLLLAALPLFMALPLLGGVSPIQVMSVFVVTAVTVALCGSVGVMMGLWREKTFQAIALTVMTLLMYVALGQFLSSLSWMPETLRFAFSPASALTASASPLASLSASTATGVGVFVLTNLVLLVVITGWSIRKIRDWNPSREVRIRPVEPETDQEYAAISQTDEGDDAIEATPASWKVRNPRRVWKNPILWREIRTWAYGRKIVLIRLVFASLFAIVGAILFFQIESGAAYEAAGRVGRSLPAATLPLAFLGVVSMVLVNALAVNSVTGERDGLALDLLLVTDLRPSEFIFGKLGGIFFVAKEMMILPIALLIYITWKDVMSVENCVYAIIGAIVLYVFVSMLGIHSGLNHVASRTAILASLGTVFFLCVGVAVCMTIMVSFRGSFEYQLPPFLIMIMGGGAALFATLGWRNPSPAVLMSSFALPAVTFYAITQFLLQIDHLYVFAVIAAGYSFTTAAMMIPTLSEFDVSLGRDRRAGEDEGG